MDVQAWYRVTGQSPVMVDGETRAPGAMFTTASDVAFLLSIQALTRVDAPETEAEGEGA